MEKFALLNLLKAIDGLQNKNSAENPPPQEFKPEQKPSAVQQPAEPAPLPNFMYETLVRHEEISNRLRNKR